MAELADPADSRNSDRIFIFPILIVETCCRNLDLGLSAPVWLVRFWHVFSQGVSHSCFWQLTGSSSVQPLQKPPYPSKSSPCQNAAGDREVDGEGIEEARRGDLLVRAEIQHLGIRRCVSNPPAIGEG